MRKTLLLLMILLPAVAYGQNNTTVTSTVKDANNVAYIYGTFSVSLVNNSGQQATFGGNPTFQQTYSGSLNASGVLSVSLPSVTVMAPTGLQWQFFICANPRQYLFVFPQPSNQVCFSYTSTGTQISGTSIDLSTSMAPVIPVVPLGSGNQSSPSGISFCMQGCFNVKNFGAIADTKKDPNVTVTASSPNISDTTNSPWVSTDVGKFIWCAFPNTGTLNVPVGTKILTFTDSAHVILNANSTGSAVDTCEWYTQSDLSAFRAATTAAIASLTAGTPIPGATVPTLAQQATVYAPPGGYQVEGAWLIDHNPSVTQFGVNFAGAGMSSTIIYQNPSIVNDSFGFADHVDYLQATDMNFGGFTLDCGTVITSVAAAMIRFDHTNRAKIHDIQLVTCGDTTTGGGKFFLNGASQTNMDHIYDNTGSTGNVLPTINCLSGCIGHFKDIWTTNPGAGPSFLCQSGAHGATGGFSTLESFALDEGSNPGAIQLTSGCDLNIVGGVAFAGTTDVIDVDGTSVARLNDVNLVPFGGSCGGGTRNAVKEVAGSLVMATASTFQGCGATGAVAGPSTATFVNEGGNNFQNCPGTPCPAVTPATFATTGFTGGIVPTASIQMPSNTCYPVQGNLLATAQNICSFVLTTTQQITSLSAQSGGTTPANSSCTTAPVITLSDGTRSATMTMTTGKTFWTSGVDANTNIPGQVFATGATLTVSIGANTCATPPSNVSVTYNLQSVLAF